MSSIRHFILALIWMCSFIGCLGQSTPATSGKNAILTEADLRKIFSDATKQVNEFYKINGFPIPILASSSQVCSLAFKTDHEYNEAVGIFVGTEQALVSCEILAASGKFVNFHNYAAAHAFQRSPMVEIQPTPKWTKEQAIEMATKFANIFTKTWGISLGHAMANYNYLAHDVDKKTGKLLTAPGQWTVTWLEQTPSGIFYQSGGVTVQLSEQYGPDAVYINFSPQYEEEHINPIAKDKALIEAHKGLDKILIWGPAKTALGNVRVLDTPPPFPILMIVQPDNVTEQSSLESGANSNQLKARLAWVVTYKVIASTGNGNGLINVYIDAEDGSFLGGYF